MIQDINDRIDKIEDNTTINVLDDIVDDFTELITKASKVALNADYQEKGDTKRSTRNGSTRNAIYRDEKLNHRETHLIAIHITDH